jgi:Mg2+ and Co2+ transporter CorA
MTPPLDSTLVEHSQPQSTPAVIRLARVFDERVMGLLALVALGTALGPMVFDVSPGVERALTVVEWVLVAMFAAEFLLQGAIAPDRHAWMRSPWRLIDLVTVLGPIAALLPQVSDVASGSLMLRMLRLGRAVAFGTRAGSVAVRRPRRTVQTLRGVTPVVTMTGSNGDLRTVRSDWDNFLRWAAQPDASWFHVANLDDRRFQELAEAAGLSPQEVARVLDEGQHSKLTDAADHATLVIQMPTMLEDRFPELHRDRVLAVVTAAGILTATTGTFDLPSDVTQLAQRARLAIYPFPARIACALLALAGERYVTVAQRFDEEARRLEGLEGGNEFLQETFRLRREVSAAALDVWHLKGIVRALADGKTRLRGIDLKEEKYLDDLLAETDSLHETISETKEEVKSLIELHINLKSFEMNGFLKLLAVVSFLGLIPSVVGGLLGMNVADNPWPVTLGQVAFGVAMGMATALYVFAVKGWLK